MYSSATTSSSASGLSGGALGEGDVFGEDFGEDFGEGVGEAAEEGVAEDFDLAGTEAVGFGEGVGEALASGFTGPVGFSGAAGVGFAPGLGVGEGEGAAVRLEMARQTASAKMKERDLMAEAAGSCGGNLRRRFARCQKFPHERSSSRPERDFHEAPPLIEHFRLPAAFQSFARGPLLYRARRRG